MRCGDEENGTGSRDAPSAARVNLAKEQIDEDGEGTEKDIIFPIGQRI